MFLPRRTVDGYEIRVGNEDNMTKLFSADTSQVRTLRDDFAMAALTGLCAALDYPRPSVLVDYDMLASDAYASADAMIKARK